MKTYKETQIKRRKEEIKRRKKFIKLLDKEFYHIKFKCELLTYSGLFAELDINYFHSDKSYTINKKVSNNKEHFNFLTIEEIKNFILNIEDKI